MSRANLPLLTFNRGLLSPKALARVDLDRTRLSAEVFTNFIPRTQGSMSLRPGTKYMGGSFHDTGVELIEFVASTDDVALLELANDTGSGLGTMRIWLGSDAHNLSLLGRPKVDTTVSLSDTGWSNTSTGGELITPSTVDIIPAMTGYTTDGVTISASSDDENTASGGSAAAWQVADDNNGTDWWDTGVGGNALPSWINVDFGSGNAQRVTGYSLRAASYPTGLDNMPSAWRLLGNNYDTGINATDTGQWALEDSRSAQTGWAVSEKRSYTLNDTGTADAWRHWRVYITALNGDTEVVLPELEMFAGTGSQVQFEGGTKLRLNATSIGALARVEKRVITSDTGTEHALAIKIDRGPVILRVGSTQRDDDYISEASLGTGYHNLAFTPQGDFWITLQSDAAVDRIVDSIAIADSGTVELRTPWTADDLDNIRYDQSADVVFANCAGVRPQKIER